MATSGDINGINVDQLSKTISQIKKNGNIAKFRLQAENKWVDGSHSRAVVTSFHGASKEESHRDLMNIEIDRPAFLLGGVHGPNPAEYLLVGLSGCLTTSMVAHAAAKNIKINSLSCQLEGDIDLQGFLGLSDSVAVGFEEIRAYFKIDADISDEEKEELIRITQKFSPVFSTITKPTPITCELIKTKPTEDQQPGQSVENIVSYSQGHVA